MKYAMNFLSNERWTTLGLELIAILLAASAGFIHIFEAWPHPWAPLLWMSAILVVFIAYRVGMLVRNQFFPPAPAPEAGAPAAQSDSPSLRWSAVEPNLRASDLAAPKLYIRGVGSEIINSEQATMALTQIGLLAGGDDPTDFLDAQELRAETDEDLVLPTEAAVPLFAESTMSLEQRTLMLEATGESFNAPAPRPSPQAARSGAPDDEEATLALDNQSLDTRLKERARAASPKNSANAAVSSPPKPFQDVTPAASKPRSKPEAPTRGAPSRPQKAAPSDDIVQVFDARELARQLQEQDAQDGSGQGESS